MDIYRLYSQINDEQEVYDPKEYKAFSEAETVLRKMIAEQGQRMNIASYISAIRKGKNRNYRKIVADVLENIFSETEPLSAEKIKLMRDTIEDFAEDCCLGEKEPMDDFHAYIEGGRIVIIEFDFDQNLHVEFDINTEYDYDNYGIIGSYFFIQDRNGKFKVNIEEKELFFDIPKSSNSANILLVYNCLLDNAYKVKDEINRYPESPDKTHRGLTPEQVQDHILSLTADRINLSVETIITQIKTLKELGVPIKQYKASKKEKEYWAARNTRCNEGYEIDLDFLDKVPEPVDASELGVHINPLLILFVIKTANRPMRQADIIDAIREKYSVEIARAAVGRHIEILKKFGYSIEKSKDGYIL